MEEKEKDLGYPKRDVQEIILPPHDHTHHFERTSATEFGCRSCHNHWIDGGLFLFEAGHYVGTNETLANPTDI